MYVRALLSSFQLYFTQLKWEMELKIPSEGCRENEYCIKNRMKNEKITRVGKNEEGFAIDIRLIKKNTMSDL